MKTRTDLLNHLAEKYNLRRYLEIGVQDPKQNYDKVVCQHKQSVDPAGNATYQMTSDAFFIYAGDKSEKNLFDLIFIDGLHTAEQVKKDFENSLRLLSPNGFIVLHDCNPEKEEHTIVPRPTERGHWNGDVWRFAVALKGYDELHRYTVDIDNGCMVIQNTDKEWMNPLFGITEILWNQFDKNRKELLNLISWDEFICIGSHV